MIGRQTGRLMIRNRLTQLLKARQRPGVGAAGQVSPESEGLRTGGPNGVSYNLCPLP